MVETVISVESPLPSVWVEQQAGTEWWINRLAWYFNVIIDGVRYTIGIPDGFRYNRASIHDALEWIVSKDDCGTKAPAPHDGGYRTKGSFEEFPPDLTPRGRNASPEPLVWCMPYRKFTRSEIDEIFYQMMVMDTGKTFKAKLAWLAVRWFARRW